MVCVVGLFLLLSFWNKATLYDRISFLDSIASLQSDRKSRLFAKVTGCKNEARRKQFKESADLPTGAYIDVRDQVKTQA